MLGKIKSYYFLKFLTFHITKRKKLELMKYNKSLQKEIDISLTNYKLLTGKYVISEENEKVKEYNYFTDELIYEGEYLNGKKHGKGKEYFSNNSYFEGEYINGKRWNGKFTFNNKEYEIKNGIGFVIKYEDYYGFYDKVIFEGKYKNGEKNGKGREYFEDGLKIFEGEYLNDKRWNGKINYDHTTYELKNGCGYIIMPISKLYIFEGQYVNGERNGKGKEYYPYSRLKFEGEYLNDKKIKGKEYIRGQILEEILEYEGEFLFGIKWNGKGYDEKGNVIYEINDGKGSNREYKYNKHEYLIYEGEYLYGKRHGKGKEYRIDNNERKLVYEGEYLNGIIHGKGKLYLYSRDKIYLIKDEFVNQDCIRTFEGEFKCMFPWSGIYKKYKHDKIIYEEEYYKGKLCGKGKEYNYLNGNLIYEGGYLNGLRSGEGKEYNSFNGDLKFTGEYLKGERNGKGKEYKKNKLIFVGEYLNGKRHGKGIEYNFDGKIIFEGEYENGMQKI